MDGWNAPCHYGILQNDKYGRYLVANKDLESGELIFTDIPFAVGPKPGKLFISTQVENNFLIYFHISDSAKTV